MTLTGFQNTLFKEVTPIKRTLITNGRIYTLNPRQPVVDSVLVEDERIVDLGDPSDFRLRFGGPDTNVIDLAGKTATPGLIDSHLHLSGVSWNWLHLDVSEARSKEELLQLVRERAQTLVPGSWLIGRGWDENRFPDKQIPTISELDAMAPHCPVFLTRVCGHAFLANTAALERTGYTRGTPFGQSSLSVPTGGSVVLDEAGMPTGLLLETASRLVQQHIPDPSYEELKSAMRNSIQYAMAAGMTGAHSEDLRYLGGLEQTWRIYDELLHEEGLGLRCNLLIDYRFLDALKERGMGGGYGDSHLQIGAAKIFSDGAMGRRTALLLEPYADAPDTLGTAVHDEGALYEIMRKARAQAIPVAVHAIGDGAATMVLNALEKVGPVANQRDRLIHAQVLNEDLVGRLCKPSLIADIQPRFVVGDFPWVVDRLGEERMRWSYAWKSLLQAGVACAGGSDAPVEPLQPLLGIHAAVTRRAPGDTHDGWYPQEKLSLEDALRLFTIGGAYATGEEKFKGTLEVGKYADLTVYSQDFVASQDPEALLQTDVEMTVTGGTVQFTRES